jgi:myo-inositol 2-dehydrogenase / D-chiro-inositol 1-dehydrogenase
VSDDLRVGVVGVGSMGADHAERLASRIVHASLVAVADPDLARARDLADRHDGVRAFADALDLVASDSVDAVVIASPGSVHEEQVMACLAHGKPVLCEKPLTMDAASSLRLVRAEREAGRPLVQVGFMRRFDPQYARTKHVLDSGDLGRLLLLHNVHRNRTVPFPEFRSEMIVRDSLVHEVDVARFLFGEEVVEVTVLSPSPTSHAAAGVVDPQVSVLRMAGGGLVTTEVFINSQVGYDVRCEAVAERGALSVGLDAGVHADWTTRFARAYDLEVQAWVDASRRGEVVGATAWDGYAATAVATAGLESLATGRPVPVRIQPDL